MRSLSFVFCAAVLAVAVAVIVTRLVDDPAPPPVAIIELQSGEAAPSAARQAERKRGSTRTRDRRRSDRGQRPSTPRAGKTPTETPPVTRRAPAPPTPTTSRPSGGGFAPPSDDDVEDDDDDPASNEDPFDDDPEDDSDGPDDDGPDDDGPERDD